MDDATLREIEGFTELGIRKWGRWWYIIDRVGCTGPDDDADKLYAAAIGGAHDSLKAARAYAVENYTGEYL